MSASNRTVRHGSEEPVRRQGLRRLPDLLGRVLDPPARRRGFAGSILVEDWPLIVGPALARACSPIRLDRREPPVLHLRVNGSAALEIQHMSPQIIERVNHHFGFAAVARLKLVQAPVERQPSPRRAERTPLSDEGERVVERAVATVADPDLKAALRALGRVLPPPTDEHAEA